MEFQVRYLPRVQQVVYVTYVRTPTSIGVNMILDMHTLARTLIFSLVIQSQKTADIVS